MSGCCTRTTTRGSAAPSTRRSPRAFWQTVVTGNPALGMLAALLLLLLPAAGAKPEYQHGISLLHELKYPPDFTHFEYANSSARSVNSGKTALSRTGRDSRRHRAVARCDQFLREFRVDPPALGKIRALPAQRADVRIEAGVVTEEVPAVQVGHNSQSCDRSTRLRRPCIDAPVGALHQLRCSRRCRHIAIHCRNIRPACRRSTGS